MLEVRQLADRLGLSEHQTRRLLRSLDGVLRGHLKRGRDNRILVDDGAIAILDRAVALWRGGIPLRDLGQTIAGEMEEGAPHAGDGPAPNPERPASNRCPTCEAYRKQIEHLEGEVRWLRSRLEELQARALPPAGSRPWSWWRRLFRG